MPPTEVWKPGKAPVKRNPIAAEFHRESRVIGVRDKIASSFNFAAELREYPPMVQSRSQDMYIFPRAKIFDEFQGNCERRRFLEDFRMGNNPKAPAENQIGDCHAGRIGKRLSQPRLQFRVPFGILAVNVNEHVHVEQNHRPSIASRILADEARSTPGCTPDPLNVFKGRTAADLADFGREASEARNASSIVSVVLMHHNIIYLHHDVKRDFDQKSAQLGRRENLKSARRDPVAGPVHAPAQLSEGGIGLRFDELLKPLHALGCQQ